MTVQAPSSVRARPSGWFLLPLIGAFKLLKAVALTVAAISAFDLIHKNIGEVLIAWAHRFHIAPGKQWLEHLVERVLTVTERQLIVVGIILLAYAAMFLVEGIGLLLMKHWAEWMTVITTAGLIPIEIYELVERPTVVRGSALLINITIAAYLAERVRRETIERRHNRQIKPN